MLVGGLHEHLPSPRDLDLEEDRAGPRMGPDHVLDVPEQLAHERNATRPDRQFGPHVLRRQRREFRRSLPGLKKEGFNHVWVLCADEVDGAEVERTPLWNNRRELHGPFDIVGDVHGWKHCDP